MKNHSIINNCILVLLCITFWYINDIYYNYMHIFWHNNTQNRVLFPWKILFSIWLSSVVPEYKKIINFILLLIHKIMVMYNRTSIYTYLHENSFGIKTKIFHNGRIGTFIFLTELFQATLTRCPFLLVIRFESLRILVCVASSQSLEVPEGTWCLVVILCHHMNSPAV